MKRLLIFFILMLALKSYGQEVGNDESQPTGLHAPMLINEVFYLRTLGNLEAQYPTAAGLSVGYGVFYKDIMVKLQVGYTSYAVNPDPSAQGGNSLSAIHFLGGARYLIAKGDFMPYVSAAVGANIVTETGSYTVDRKSRILFATQYGIGAMVHFVDKLGVDLAAKYNAHFFYDPRMMTGFEYGMGLTWSLTNE